MSKRLLALNTSLLKSFESEDEDNNTEGPTRITIDDVKERIIDQPETQF